MGGDKHFRENKSKWKRWVAWILLLSGAGDALGAKSRQRNPANMLVFKEDRTSKPIRQGLGRVRHMTAHPWHKCNRMEWQQSFSWGLQSNGGARPRGKNAAQPGLCSPAHTPCRCDGTHRSMTSERVNLLIGMTRCAGFRMRMEAAMVDRTHGLSRRQFITGTLLTLTAALAGCHYRGYHPRAHHAYAPRHHGGHRRRRHHGGHHGLRHGGHYYHGYRHR